MFKVIHAAGINQPWNATTKQLREVYTYLENKAVAPLSDAACCAPLARNSTVPGATCYRFTRATPFCAACG